MSSDIPDWEAKYWANRQAQKQREQQPQVPGHTPQQRNLPPTREIDAVSILQQRMVANQFSAGAPESGGQNVFLREGGTYYKQVQAENFGHSVSLIKSMGMLTNVSGRAFSYMGEVKGYCIDNLAQVDLAKINENPDRMLALVKVRIPLSGDILVPKSSIIETSYGSAGKQLLRG